MHTASDSNLLFFTNMLYLSICHLYLYLLYLHPRRRTITRSTVPAGFLRPGSSQYTAGYEPVCPPTQPRLLLLLLLACEENKGTIRAAADTEQELWSSRASCVEKCHLGCRGVVAQQSNVANFFCPQTFTACIPPITTLDLSNFANLVPQQDRLLPLSPAFHSHSSNCSHCRSLEQK